VTNTLKNLTLKVWRQDGPNTSGSFETHTIEEITDEASFLEMIDILNERLIEDDKEAIVFDHDCREGICGTCSLMINGQAHGPERGTATCQLHMRKFSSGDTIVIEPWRASAFPIIRDLMVDRSSFDRIVEAGGYITAATGGAPDANLIPVPKPVSDAAMDAAQCIGCGACVAACPNGAANLFTAERSPTSTCFLRVKQSGIAVQKTWSKRWIRTLGRAPTTVSVRRHVRKRYQST